ncbi:hypothetical protein ACFL47_10870 [Candidatus Latescibacterota bacterium]
MVSAIHIAVRDTSGVQADKVSVTVFRGDSLEFIGLLPDPHASPADYARDDLRLDLTGTGNPYYVYDVRKKEFLGANTSIPLNLTPGKAELFALVPYRIKDIDLRVKSPVVKIGDTLDFTASMVLQLSRQLLVKPGRHVLRLEVAGPDGVVHPSFTKSLEAERGTVTSSITVGPDETPGRWVVRVVDVITGKRAERSFMVMETGNMIVE